MGQLWQGLLKLLSPIITAVLTADLARIINVYPAEETTQGLFLSMQCSHVHGPSSHLGPQYRVHMASCIA
eukprot:6073688-Amphidinium_carterae.2